jgi:hypothetical protein
MRRSSKEKPARATHADKPLSTKEKHYANNSREKNCEIKGATLRSDDPNALTVLTSCSGRLTKIIKKDGTVIGYDRAYTFSARTVSVATRKELVTLLTDLNGQEGSGVIHGAPVDGTNLERTRRLLHDDKETGDKATFRDVPRTVHALDIENILPPTGLTCTTCVPLHNTCGTNCRSSFATPPTSPSHQANI